ncbi:ATPase associated with various cellular activities AAA_5 [Roseibium sp. TrichSKD4]|uniref:AAA family ATPase n=1 Tax=Roseibium sp. TrichSKD4 TaxID=744980 RepID=UPI0001E56B45|nr:MoxR family ATPase [Roseibium sp. TrichSKD4]EFO30113.1 ATPase associated with various cellular activities AAA_5 [Roseibium sp. TrichSKD4]
MATVTVDRASTLLGHLVDANIPAHLWGAPGIGKSDTVKALAKGRGADLVDIRLSMFDPVDLRGLPTITDGSTSWLRPAIWPKEDKPTILFFDEMDRAAPAVQNAALQIVLDRKIGEHKLPDQVRIIAAGNGETDRVGTNRTSTAANDRFAHIQIEPDVDAWKDWAYRANLHPLVVAFVSFRPDLLHYTLNEQLKSDRSSKTRPTPRGWQDVASFADHPVDIQADLVASRIGDGPAAEFNGFAQIFRELPSLDGVISDPTGSAIPSSPGGRFAIAIGLAMKADPSNYANILTYADRLPGDVAAMLAIDATRRDPGLSHTKAHIDFLARNKELFQ